MLAIHSFPPHQEEREHSTTNSTNLIFALFLYLLLCLPYYFGAYKSKHTYLCARHCVRIRALLREDSFSHQGVDTAYLLQNTLPTTTITSCRPFSGLRYMRSLRNSSMRCSHPITSFGLRQKNIWPTTGRPRNQKSCWWAWLSRYKDLAMQE